MSSTFARSAMGVGVAALAAALTLSACSSSNGSDPPPASSTSGSAAGGAGPGQRGPAASGTIGAITGTTMQVQNQQSGQVAVTWTSTTKFNHQVATTLAAIKAGTCVTAIAPSGTSATATSFTATSVTISTATNGQCGGGFGGGGGQPPSGLPSGFPSGGQLPSGFPSGFPPGARSGPRNFGSIATGKVTSASGSILVIAARQFTPGSSSSPSTTNKTVTIGSSTKILTEASTTASSLKVGLCATAEGKADSGGTVTATSVRITQPTNGQCTIGFGGRGPGG